MKISPIDPFDDFFIAHVNLTNKITVDVLEMDSRLDWLLFNLDCKLVSQMLDLKFGPGYRDKFLANILKQIGGE